MATSPLDTITLPEFPLSATPKWLAAVQAAGRQCRCQGVCGKSHRAAPGERCPHRLGIPGIRLHLRGTAVYCTACFTPISNNARKRAEARARRAAAALYLQDDLFALLGDA